MSSLNIHRYRKNSFVIFLELRYNPRKSPNYVLNNASTDYDLVLHIYITYSKFDKVHWHRVWVNKKRKHSATGIALHNQSSWTVTNAIVSITFLGIFKINNIVVLLHFHVYYVNIVKRNPFSNKHSWMSKWKSIKFSFLKICFFVSSITTSGDDDV